jgi:hypothetical protein
VGCGVGATVLSSWRVAYWPVIIRFDREESASFEGKVRRWTSFLSFAEQVRSSAAARQVSCSATLWNAPGPALADHHFPQGQ